jgi:hypothetical protein
MIEGLAPRAHQLHFGGSSKSFSPANCCTNLVQGLSTETTANIVVVPEPGSALLVLTGIMCLFALRGLGLKLRTAYRDGGMRIGTNTWT